MKKQAADVNKSFESSKPVILAPITNIGSKTIMNKKKELSTAVANSNQKIDVSLDVAQKMSGFNLSNGIEGPTAQREMSASQRSLMYTMKSDGSGLKNNQPLYLNENETQTMNGVPERKSTSLLKNAEEGADHLGNFDCMKIIQLIDNILVQSTK